MSAIDWIDVCPADFLDELKKRLDCPPGFQEASEEYASTFGDDIYDTDTVIKHADYNLTLEDKPESYRIQQEFRKKYAQQWGEYAEALVARHILEQGLPLRELDWRPNGGKKKSKGGVRRGEIDIITQRGNRIIFIEVKARCGRHTDPLQAVDANKIRRLCRGADIYLKMQRETYEYQFDIALITGDYLNPHFEYIEDAFLAPLRTTY